MTKTWTVPGFSKEVVVDGMDAQPVKMTSPPTINAPEGCGAGRHCAKHGDGPFYCCRCGAEFRIIP